VAKATVSSRGQTVIPKPVREHLGLHPGDEVEFVMRDDGEVLLKPATEDVRKLKGILHRPGRKPVSLRAMNAAIRRRGSGR
jgi:AbrB family looped-hinge helix DNA binding protein